MTIKSILSSDQHIVVAGGSPPYVNFSITALSVGTVRYNPMKSVLEVYDGHTWMEIFSQHVSISLSAVAAAAIEWATKKMAEESAFQELSEKHPAVKIAYDNFQQSANILKVTVGLIGDETNNKGKNQ